MNRARAYLCNALASARCHDACSANFGDPPSPRSSSVFLAYCVARALAASGGIDAAAQSVLLSYVQQARKGDSYSYDMLAPIDADDTAFARRALILMGTAPSSDDVLPIRRRCSGRPPSQRLSRGWCTKTNTSSSSTIRADCYRCPVVVDYCAIRCPRGCGRATPTPADSW